MHFVQSFNTHVLQTQFNGLTPNATDLAFQKINLIVLCFLLLPPPSPYHLSRISYSLPDFFFFILNFTNKEVAWFHSTQSQEVLNPKRIEYILEWNLIEKSVKRPFFCTLYMICTLWNPFQTERDWQNSYRVIL